MTPMVDKISPRQDQADGHVRADSLDVSRECNYRGAPRHPEFYSNLFLVRKLSILIHPDSQNSHTDPSRQSEVPLLGLHKQDISVKGTCIRSQHSPSMCSHA